MTDSKPLIALLADTRWAGDQAYQMVGEKYLRAVTEGVGGVPMIVPVLDGLMSFEEVCDRVDGIILTGSPSNIEPHHYGGTPSILGTLHDPARDAFTLPLIKVALSRGIPILAICRGLQEMNVALGGSLHQQVHEVSGMQDHREDQTQTIEVQYGPSHEISILPDGLLADLIGQSRIKVNSLHGQGVDRLGQRLRPEAVADDGLIEAFTMPSAPGFNLAVQWHPEWQLKENPVSKVLFHAFGHACRMRRASGV